MLITSFHFKPLTRELQGAAILGHSADDIIGYTSRDDGFDVEAHCHIGSDEAGDVGDDFFGDLACITTDTLGI